MFIEALFTISKLWRQPKFPSVDEWIKKAVVHLHKRTLLGCKKKKKKKKKKNEILPFETA